MKKPVVLVVMDGVGETPEELGNMVKKATTPTLNELKETCPWQIIKAHGTAVGLPSDDDMGNSEVGHNALGCGQIYSQGAKLVNESIESGKIYTSDAWKNLVSDLKDNGATLHFIGLLSDGNVHSNISHLIAMLKEAKKEGVKRVRCHILLDGRDVPATSALEYVQELEDVLASLNDADFDGKIASGGGRMTITMDRYQANWPMVKAGWDTHVHGIGRQFATAKEAIETYRAETGVIDQDLPAFVIAENGKPVGKMEDGDSVILFNFRGDRAQEISMAFDGDSSFDKFDRGEMPKVKYAGMLQYDGDLCIPKSFLVNPPEIRNTLTELLVANGVNEFACSETQKFGHVTYFWNGNRSEKFSEELETWVEVPSDVRSFDECPWLEESSSTGIRRRNARRRALPPTFPAPRRTSRSGCRFQKYVTWPNFCVSEQANSLTTPLATSSSACCRRVDEGRNFGMHRSLVLLEHTGILDLGHFAAVELVERAVAVERHRDFLRAVAAEFEEDNAVAVLHLANGLSILRNHECRQVLVNHAGFRAIGLNGFLRGCRPMPSPHACPSPP